MSAESEQLAGLLGETLRRRRDERGQSLRATAESAGVSPGHLSDVERGRKELSLERLGDVARALGTSAGEIFLDLAIALGAAPPRPARYPAGFAPDPRDELAWVSERLAEPELRTVAAFGTFLASRQARGATPA